MPGVQAFSFPSNESFARHQFPLGVGGGSGACGGERALSTHPPHDTRSFRMECSPLGVVSGVAAGILRPFTLHPSRPNG